METQNKILTENTVRTKKLQELINNDQTVKDYLNTPVPESLSKLYSGSDSERANTSETLRSPTDFTPTIQSATIQDNR